jgi:large subunit ribosomal protein L5
MQERYQEAVPVLQKTFNYRNIMEVPRIEKIVINIGLGEAMDDSKALEAALTDLTTIAGQKPIQTKARKSIANFKLREGRIIGSKVTLRGYRMWAFLDRLVNVALPRVRDFRGVSPNSFDGRGNYTLGLRDQLIFPEIEYDKIDKLRGMEITIVTTAKNDEHSRELLRFLGMPFRKEA